MSRNLLAIRQQIGPWHICCLIANRSLASLPCELSIPKFSLESTVSSSLLEGCCDTKGRYLYHASSAPAMKALLSRFVGLFLCPHGEPQIFYFQEKHVLQILFPPVSLSKSNSALFTTNLCLSPFEYRFKGTFHEYSFFPCVLKPAGKICVISYSYGKMGQG